MMGGAGASILVLLGGEVPCDEDSGISSHTDPTWCRVCCSLWLSLQSCKRPRALQLQDPAGIVAPFSPPLSALLLPTLCPFPRPLSYPALPSPVPLSHLVCTMGDTTRKTCSRLIAAGPWDRAETRLPLPRAGSHPASQLCPGTSAPQQPPSWGEGFIPGS